MKPVLAGLDLTDAVITGDALHCQRETARHLCHDRSAHYVLILKANLPSLLDAAITALTGSAADFAGTSATEHDRGHGRRERRTIRTAPAHGIDFPHAAQIFQIRRDAGKLHEPCWRTKEIIYGVTDLTPRQASPADLAAYARGHWTVENRLHWVRDVTFHEDASQVRTGNAPRAMAALRNLAISALPDTPTSRMPDATQETTTNHSPFSNSENNPKWTNHKNAGAVASSNSRQKTSSSLLPSGGPRYSNILGLLRGMSCMRILIVDAAAIYETRSELYRLIDVGGRAL